MAYSSTTTHAQQVQEEENAEDLELEENVAYNVPHTPTPAQPAETEENLCKPDTDIDIQLRENVAYCPMTIPAQQVQGEENAGIADIASNFELEENEAYNIITIL